MLMLQCDSNNRPNLNRLSIRVVFFIGILIFSTSFAASSNEVIYWNEQALNLVKKNNVPPPKASRMLGLLHASMFDAANSIARQYQPYEIRFDNWTGKSINQVVAHAAAYILKNEFPADEELIEILLEERHAGLDNSGVEVAKYILGQHPLEFSELEPPVINQDNPWVPTSPQFAEYLLPKWCALKPLGIVSVKDYRKSGPPKSDSSGFAADVEETRIIGSKKSIVRTVDQTEIALFWADGRGTVTPPGHWNQIAVMFVEANRLSIVDSARVMALLNIAMADAAIVAWDMKYIYQLARPITMFEGEGWEPLITTPPFPEYVSGHSTFSGAAAEVLTQLFEKVPFSTRSQGLPNVTRLYEDFYAAADEAGRSRIYGGIHFEFSNRDGRAAGQEIGRYVVDHFMQKNVVSTSNE